MKKLMKAIAFFAVMSLALSTVAFAAAEVTDFATKTVSITVEGVQKGEQVAIVIAEAGAEELNKDTIVFVDQKAAGSTTATFNAVLTNTDVEAIDVYAGYATNSAGSAVLAAENVALISDEEEVTELTITLADVQIVDDITEILKNGYVEHRVDAGTKAAVVYFKLNAENAEAGDIAGMNWAFSVKNIETSEVSTKYVKADAGIVAALGTILTGDVEIAAAFNSTGYTVEDAWAVFSVKGEDVTVEKE